MSNMQSKRKRTAKRYVKKKKTDEMPSSFNIKLFISLSILLVVLLMKKYDLTIGEFNIDSVYEVVYYNEDFSELKDKIFTFNSKNDKQPENTIDKSLGADNP